MTVLEDYMVLISAMKASRGGKNVWLKESHTCKGKQERSKMPEKVTSEDLELLGQLGVDTKPKKKPAHTPREQRIIAGYEEIERFAEKHGRLPAHGEHRDIFERLYAVRLDQLRRSSECRNLLQDIDKKRLLDVQEDYEDPAEEVELGDVELLQALGATKRGQCSYFIFGL